MFYKYAYINNVFRKQYIDSTCKDFCVNIAKIENIITVTNII